MDTLLRTLANSLLLPPGINIVLLVLGLILLPRFHTTSVTLIIISIISLYGVSTAIVASRLIAPLQQHPPIDIATLATQTPLNEQAIVILTGGGQYAPEYQQHHPSYTSLVREIYAADLHKKTGLPIMVVGGKGSTSTVPESKVIQQHLTEYFNIPTVWLEINSRDTWENAKNAKKLFTEKQISSFYLVTSAWHMPRALSVFEKFGMQPTPAPTDFILVNGTIMSFSHWLPSARMLLIARTALHEYFARYLYFFYNKQPGVSKSC